MKIGIILAVEEELQALLKLSTIKKEFDIFDLHFYEVTISKKDCVLVECGVGKVNAARCCQILIDNIKVDYIFNAGVAGGISPSLKVGDIVIANKLVQHDFDITAFNHEKGYIPKIGVYLKSDDYLVKMAMDNKNKENIHLGNIASGDIFCTDPDMTKEIYHHFNALCVDMESASIAQVAFLAHIPFLILRSISDIPNNDNQITYENFLEDSCQVVANYLKKIIQSL